ncbi:MAG: hypothetical protein ACUVWX_05865 [Kiritimatiellia bacterium]
MKFFRVTLPISLAFMMAVVAIASIFIAHHWSNNFIRETAYWSKVISGITMFIGAFNLLRVHYNKIKRQQKGWGYSVLLFTFFALMLTFGILNRGPLVKGQIKAYPEAEAQALAARIESRGGKLVVMPLLTKDGQPLQDQNGNALFCLFDPPEARDRMLRSLLTDKGKPLSGANGKQLYADLRTGRVTDQMPIGFLGPLEPRTRLKEKDLTTWLYEAVQRPASATQYSLLGFFICSAAYRTFRAKTPLAAVLLVSALIVMLGQVPISALLWDKIPVLSGWLLDIPNMAVKRAILFGICVGSVGTSLRVMFGIERSYMGGE